MDAERQEVVALLRLDSVLGALLETDDSRAFVALRDESVIHVVDGANDPLTYRLVPLPGGDYGPSVH